MKNYYLFTINKNRWVKEDNVYVVNKNELAPGLYVGNVLELKERQNRADVVITEGVYKIPDVEEELKYYIIDLLTQEEVLLNVYTMRIIAAFCNLKITSKNIYLKNIRMTFSNLLKALSFKDVKQVNSICHRRYLITIIKEFKELLEEELRSDKCGVCYEILTTPNISNHIWFNVKMPVSGKTMWHKDEYKRCKFEVEYINLEKATLNLDEVISGNCINYYFNDMISYVVAKYKKKSGGNALESIGHEYIYHDDETIHKFYIY